MELTPQLSDVMISLVCDLILVEHYNGRLFIVRVRVDYPVAYMIRHDGW